MKIKLCIITLKKIFYLKDKVLISNMQSFDQVIASLGLKMNEIEKLVLVGFNEEKSFYGDQCNLGEIEEVFTIGPKFREEKRYFLDRIINIFNTIKEIWKNRKILEDIEIIYAPFFEYVVFEFLVLKLICKKAKFFLYIMGDYPELNFYKRKSLFLRYFLIVSTKISQFLVDEVWVISEFLLKKYKNKKNVLMPLSSVKLNEIGLPRKFNFSKEIKLLFVGRLEAEKRPEIALFLLKALHEKNYNANLTIAGDGSLREKLEKMTTDLNLKKCKFLGWIKNREELMEVYKENDILLLPSAKGEGLGLVILEAMAKGLIVLATRSGGPEELIEDGVNGFLFDPEASNLVNLLAEKIQFLADNPEICEKISQNNIEKVKQFTFEKFSFEKRERIIKQIKSDKNL